MHKVRLDRRSCFLKARLVGRPSSVTRSGLLLKGPARRSSRLVDVRSSRVVDVRSSWLVSASTSGRPGSSTSVRTGSSRRGKEGGGGRPGPFLARPGIIATKRRWERRKEITLSRRCSVVMKILFVRSSRLVV